MEFYLKYCLPEKIPSHLSVDFFDKVWQQLRVFSVICLLKMGHFQDF